MLILNIQPGLWCSTTLQFRAKMGPISINLPAPDALAVPGAAMLLQREDGSFRVAFDIGDGDPCAVDGHARFDGTSLRRTLTGPIVGGAEDIGANNLRKAIDKGQPFTYQSKLKRTPAGHIIETVDIEVVEVCINWELQNTAEAPESAFETWFIALRQQPPD